MSVNGVNCDGDVQFSSVLMSRILLFVGSIVVSKVFGISLSCLNECGWFSKGFPKSITMLEFAFGLAMATQICGASLFSEGSP